MRLPGIVVAAPLPWLLAACAAPDLPLRAFARAAAESPQDQPARLWFVDGELCGFAVAAGPGNLPQPVRTALEAIAPGGRTVFSGREWGRRGHGFRVDKTYDDLPGQDPGAAPHFRSVLLDQDGDVLERTHSWPLTKVPHAVLDAAMAFGGAVERAEIVSGSDAEEGWRVTTTNRAGWTFVVELSLAGKVLHAHRVVAATVHAD